MLILHKHSGPRSVSDQLYNYIMAQASGTAGHSGSICDDAVENRVAPPNIDTMIIIRYNETGYRNEQ